MSLDNIRFGTALLISAVLTVIITVIGYSISNVVYPAYQYSLFEGLLLVLFVAGCFGVLLGFSYFFVGFWQETKIIGNPNKTEVESEKSEESIHEKPRKSYVVVEISPENKWNPEAMFTTYNLEDFGLRQFSDDDDWINMKKSQK
jgi:predicted membrane protein